MLTNNVISIPGEVGGVKAKRGTISQHKKIQNTSATYSTDYGLADYIVLPVRSVGLRRERRGGLLQLQRVHLLAELAFAHLPAALLGVAPVLAAREGGRDWLVSCETGTD